MNEISVICRRIFALTGHGSMIAVAIMLLGHPDSALAQQGPGVGRPANVSKEDLASAVDALRSSIKDISASYSYKAEPGAAPNLISYDSCRVVAKGSKLYFSNVYAADEQRAQGLVFQREVAFNGRVTIIHLPQTAKAIASPSKEGETDYSEIPLFRFMMYSGELNDTRKGVDPNDLVSIIRWKGSKLLPLQEDVGGHWCYVIERDYGMSDKVLEKIYIDPERGYLPIKEQAYDSNTPQGLIRENDIDEAVEVTPGIWLPTKCRTTDKLVLVANLRDDGKPDVAVNTGVKDDFFDLAKRLPTGTEVIDQRLNTSFVIGGKDFDGMLKDLETVPEWNHLPIQETDSNVNQNKPPSVNSVPSGEIPLRRGFGWVIATVVVALMCCTAIWLFVRRGSLRRTTRR
jgi:hypothetical protein